MVRAHLESCVALHGAGVGIDDRAAHADRASVLDDHAFHAAAADDPRSGAHSHRQIGDVHAELGVQPATERAHAGPMAAAGVTPDRAPAVAQLAPTLFHHL